MVTIIRLVVIGILIIVALDLMGKPVDIGNSPVVNSVVAAVKGVFGLADSGSAKATIAVKEAIAAKESLAVEALTAALKDAAPAVKSKAAEALGAMKDNRAVEPLIEALGDKESAVREKAAALRKITGQDIPGDVDRWKEWRRKNTTLP